MITINVIEPGAIAEFMMEGDCVLEEVLVTIRSQYGKISTGILWNFTRGSNVNLSRQDMMHIAQTVKEHAIHKRTAYLGTADLQYGILRMYEAYAETKSVSPVMKVFRDRDAAIQWLKDA